MFKKVIIFSIFLSVIFALNAESYKKVAVFNPEGSVMESIKSIVREEISNTFVNTPNYLVVERSMIEKVLQESRFQMEGHVDDAEISELGRMMGADYVCYGSITGIGRNYYLSVKLVDVVTARVLAQSTGSTQDGVNDLVSVTSELTHKLLSQTKIETDIVSKTDTTIETTEEPVIKEPEPERDTRVEKTGYKGRHFMLATGYGVSYGGIGLRLQYRLGRNFGVGFHAGLGFDPLHDMSRVSGGIKIFPFRGLYLNLQYGTLGKEDSWDFYDGFEYRELHGASFLVGGDWNWGKRIGFGFNTALGLSVPANPIDQELYGAIDIGFVVRF